MKYELNKNNWFVQYVFTAWGVNERHFSHICPFFWLAAFSVLAFPVLLIIVLVKWIGKFIAKKDDENHQVFTAWAANYYTWITTDANAKKIFLSTFHLKRRGQLWRFYDDYLEYKDLSLFREAESIFRDILTKEWDRDAAKDKRKKELISKVVVFTRPISKFILYTLALISALFVVYLIYIGVVYLFSLPAASWDVVLKFLGQVLLFLLGAAVLILLFIYLIRKQTFVDTIFNKLGDFFSYIFSFIKIFFEENCPPVTWK